MWGPLYILIVAGIAYGVFLLYKNGAQIKVTETIHIVAWQLYAWIFLGLMAGLWLPW